MLVKKKTNKKQYTNWDWNSIFMPKTCIIFGSVYPRPKLNWGSGQ